MAAGRFRSSPPLSPAVPIKTRRNIVEIAARQEIKPFQQGELDWFCGLYSCLNALRLATHAVRPIPKSLTTKLYQAGISYLDSEQAVGETATRGMESDRQRDLLAHLAGHIRKRGIETVIERPALSSGSKIASVFDWIEASIAKGAAVLVYLDGSQDHYTVIAGIDDRHLHFFDSIGLRRIARAGCDTRRGKRYIIDPCHLVGVRLAEGLE